MVDWDKVHDAFDEFMDMTAAERHGYYDDFMEAWEDLDAEDWAAFWEMYRES